VQAASDYRDIFGRDNFFCELMDHGIGIERQVRDDLHRLKKQLDLPGLATNDLHYTYAEDAKPHEVLLCVQTGKTLADPNRFKFDAQDFYLKSPAEMRAQWDEEFPEACDNTLLIAERVDVTFTEGQDLMPRAPVPEGETEESWLVKEVERGMHARFPNGFTQRTASRSTTRSRSSSRWGSRGTSWSPPTSSSTPSPSASAAARRGLGGRLARRLRLGSPTSTRSEHKLIFERFLNPSASRCPTSTWTSTSAGAAR
jgi:DNA polymerase-3 subunit alpha